MTILCCWPRDEHSGHSHVYSTTDLGAASGSLHELTTKHQVFWISSRVLYNTLSLSLYYFSCVRCEILNCPVFRVWSCLNVTFENHVPVVKYKCRATASVSNKHHRSLTLILEREHVNPNQNLSMYHNCSRVHDSELSVTTFNWKNIVLQISEVFHFHLAETTFEGIQPNINLPFLQLVFTIEFAVAKLRHTLPHTLGLRQTPMSLAFCLHLASLSGRFIASVISFFSCRCNVCSDTG
ncbi:hypothetical protein BsWGS_22204 [Bradybaena similaris]